MVPQEDLLELLKRALAVADFFAGRDDMKSCAGSVQGSLVGQLSGSPDRLNGLDQL